MHQQEEIQKQLLAVSSFKLFQKERNASGLETAEKIEMIKLIGTSYDLFD